MNQKAPPPTVFHLDPDRELDFCSSRKKRPSSLSLTQHACTHTHVRACAFILVHRLNKRRGKKTLLGCVSLLLINWSSGPSEDRGFTLIPRRLIGADKAARTQSSCTDNWVPQLNYYGARRALNRVGPVEVWPGFHSALFIYFSVAVPQVRAIIGHNLSHSSKGD